MVLKYLPLDRRKQTDITQRHSEIGGKFLAITVSTNSRYGRALSIVPF
jgi:hypothetical protein